MSGWNPERGYGGPLVDLIQDIDRQFVPAAEVMEAAQAWILRELALARGPFPCRHFSSRGGFSLTPKVNYFDAQEHRLPFDAIASDNECSSSLYAELRVGTRLEAHSMLEALQRGIIKTGILTEDDTTEATRRRFRELGIRGKMNSHEKRIAQDKLTLCHLADAADGVSGLTWASREEELRARIFRSLSPLNVFPFPHPSSRAGGYVQQLEHGANEDLGSNPDFQIYLANFMIAKFGGPDSPAVKNWLSNARFSPRILSETEMRAYGAQRIRLLPRAQTSAVLVATSRTVTAPTPGNSTAAGMSTHGIREVVPMARTVSERAIEQWLACGCMAGTNGATKRKAASAARKVFGGEPANTRDREVYSQKLRRHIAGVCAR